MAFRLEYTLHPLWKTDDPIYLPAVVCNSATHSWQGPTSKKGLEPRQSSTMNSFGRTPRRAPIWARCTHIAATFLGKGSEHASSQPSFVMTFKSSTLVGNNFRHPRLSATMLNYTLLVALLNIYIKVARHCCTVNYCSQRALIRWRTSYSTCRMLRKRASYEEQALRLPTPPPKSRSITEASIAAQVSDFLDTDMTTKCTLRLFSVPNWQITMLFRRFLL